MTTTHEAEKEDETPSLRVLALGLASFAVIIAGALFVWSGVTTASGRIAATTRNDSSLLTAAEIDLVVDGGSEVASSGLLIDAAGLYPGLQLQRCFEVTYLGTAEGVPVRLFGQAGEGSGLEAFIDTRVDLGTGSQNGCGDFVPVDEVFTGTLASLWERHNSFESALPLMTAALDGESSWVRVSVEVMDDNEAQELTTSFWLVIEARP